MSSLFWYKCEHYPHVHTLILDTQVTLWYTPTQSLSANVYKHNHTITYEYFYNSVITHSYCKTFILLIWTFTLCNPFHTVTFTPRQKYNKLTLLMYSTYLSTTFHSLHVTMVHYLWITILSFHFVCFVSPHFSYHIPDTVGPQILNLFLPKSLLLILTSID